MNAGQLTPAQLEELRRLSTCVVASAIETFDVRLPNTGFTNSSIRCIFSDRPPTVGYAATARIRSSSPPMEGHSYYKRTDWWNELLKIPAPRIVVIEDVDKPAGLGAFVGEVHTNILMALGCAGLVTNGAVRDLEQIRPSGFPMFAGNVSVSHAYAHVFDFGGAVQIGGLAVKPGDLIHGDIHGVQTIPLDIAAKVPSVAHKILRRRERLIEVCRSADFSLDRLREAIEKDGRP
jgi:4-hydroxy-4-methyl-2-oxoglutarate aldolase